MNTEDLKNRFKEETGLDVSSGVMNYSTSYVYWLEQQLLIHSVVVNEAEDWAKPDWECTKHCDCIKKEDCEEFREVAFYCETDDSKHERCFAQCEECKQDPLNVR